MSKMDVPIQLKSEGMKFVRLRGKIPIDSEWQKDNNFDYDSYEIVNYKDNVGVLCGRNNLVVLDIDGNGLETLKLINDKLPQTYTVRTGSKGYHMYYFTDELVSSTNVEFNNSHIDIKADRGQVVMEGSIHPETKKKYICFYNKDIKSIPKDMIFKFFEVKQDNGVTVKKTFTKTDDTRSAIEYRTICSLLARGLSKEEIFIYMEAFDKWKHSINEYKEHTYNKAHYFIQSKKTSPVDEENIRYRVIELLVDKDPNTKDQSTKEAEEILVSYLTDKFHFKTILQDEQTEVWAYSQGIYSPIGQSLAREEIRRILGRGFGNAIVNRIISKITADTYISPKDFFKNDYPYLLPVSNGLLNIKTLELSYFTPEKVFFTKIPINYNPTAECKNIIKHLRLVLKESEDVELFQEALGNCLLKRYTFQKAVMLVGSGRNGKGVTLDLITRLLGIENCSAITLEQLETDQFALSELHGKLANIGGDLNRTSLNNTGRFKTATGGDLLTAARKFMTPIYFINYAKFFFACNELPLVFDNSRGFWDRWLYFEFPYTFCSKEEHGKLDDKQRLHHKIANPLIKDSLFKEDELEGFLLFGLEGLQRILKNNGFTESVTFENIKNKWMRQSDSFRAFCLDSLKTEWDSTISKSELRRKYSEYCQENKIRAVGDKHIKQVLTTEYGVNEKQISKDYSDLTGVQREYVWEGITWT